MVFLFLSVQRLAMCLDPRQPIGAYVETKYTVEDGLPSNVVNHILQTQDGFLWIATDSGLARFNGREFQAIALKGIPATSQGSVHALAATADGSLWIGTDAGLVRISESEQEHIDSARPTVLHLGNGEEDQIASLEAGRDGTLWVGTNSGLFSIVNGRVSKVIPHAQIGQIRQGLGGELMIVSHGQYFKWAAGHITRDRTLPSRLGVRPDRFYSVAQDSHGAMWYSTGAGTAREVGGVLERFSPYAERGSGFHNKILEDHHGVMWLSLSPHSRLSRYGYLNEPPRYIAQEIRALVEARDGGLWIGTNGEGLIRLKDRAATAYTTADGLGSDIVMTVLARKNGEVWAGGNCGGLSVLRGDRFTTYTEKDGLLNACVWSLAEDSSGSLWVGTWGGLFRFSKGRFQKCDVAPGHPDVNVRQIVVARDGTLWVATGAGVAHLQDDRLRTYTAADGLPSNEVLAVYEDHSGRIWAGTSEGFAVLNGAGFIPVPSSEQISHPRFIGLGEHPDGDIFAMSVPKGIDHFENGMFHEFEPNLDLLSFVRFRNDLWFSGGNGIFRLSADDLSNRGRQQDAPLNYGIIERGDGLLSTQCSIGNPNIALGSDGRLWVATVKGLVSLLPADLQPSNTKCPLFIQQITVGKSRQAVGTRLDLPPGNHRLEIKFDAVELIAPEKILFQYRLDGVDSEWLSADSTRTAVYTEVPIGVHEFHLRACNRTGVWDPAGIGFRIQQEPYFYETTGFRVLCLALALYLAFEGYRLRVRKISAQIQARLQGGLSERERIARDLHDTLLQSVQGLILHIQAASDQLPKDNPTRRSMELALDRADEILRQARERVRDLRDAFEASDNLAECFATAAAWAQKNSNIGFNVLIEGMPRNLHRLVREEIKAIGLEAISNAFRHSGAQHIEVEVSYRRDSIHLRFRDDGRGIDPAVVSHGKPLHWGLIGMRERAESIGGRLVMHSKPSVGTVIELWVPASIAYGARGNRFRFFTQLLRYAKSNTDRRCFFEDKDKHW
jgi:ligand-binding sensor domain-containing protein/signal transduction histidine kinase